MSKLSSEDLQEFALWADSKADDFQERDLPELATKFREVCAASLDAAFPHDEAETQRATSRLQAVVSWLREFDASL